MNHDKLRELAQHVEANGPADWFTFDALRAGVPRFTPGDARFVSEFGPQLVLALLDELRDAKAKLADAWEEGKVAGASVNEGWEDTLTNPYQDIS